MTVAANSEVPNIAITTDASDTRASEGSRAAVNASEPRRTTVMKLREWNVSHAYASYYLEQITDLDAAAEALVRAGIASSAYVADGLAYWMAKGKLEKHLPELNWREHENHAELKLPDGVEGWTKKGLFEALLHRFSEKKLMSPVPGPQHEYVRAAMEPSSLVFEDEEVVVCPTLKLYQTGVFTFSYEVIGEGTVDLPQFVTRYVNLFTRWCDEAWVPHAIAMLGAATSLHREAKDRAGREANWGEFLLMRKAGEEAVQTVGVDDLQFKMFPAHAPLDDHLASVLLEVANDPKLGRKLPPKVREFVAQISPASPADPQAPKQNTSSTVAAAEMDEVAPGADPATTSMKASASALSADAAESTEPAAESQETSSRQDPTITPNVAMEDRAAEAPPEEPADRDGEGAHDGSEGNETVTQSYQLSDMFDNAEFAARVALDPVPDAKTYLRHGLTPKLTRGNYWCSRPQVSIIAFDDQPTTATEIRERFGDQLGLIMMRVSRASQSVARAQLGDSLRPFEDWTLHVGQALSLCVYARDRRYQVHPPILETTDRACLVEMVDYLSMRCHQLDERASLAKSVAEARAVRAELGAVENLARTGFRMGELNTAAKVAWQQFDLPGTVKEAREKVSLAAEAATERTSEQGARFNAALAVVFGIVGAAGLTDSLTKPVWTKLDLPLPGGLEGPVCFGVSAALVGIVLWLVSRFLKRS